MRRNEPKKELRRQSAVEGETDDKSKTTGASGGASHTPKRPGRAASLMSTSHNTRSHKWRSAGKGPPSMRRGVLAKGSHTGRNRSGSGSARSRSS